MRQRSRQTARHKPRFAGSALIAVSAVIGSLSAHAQGSSGEGFSVLPYTRQGYVGINVGKPKYETSCGVGAFVCDDPNTSLHVYTGGMFNQNLGLEFGYLNMGRADRGGGTTRAQGINLSLLARAPIGPVSVFAKAGTTYGRTEVSASALSGIASGKESGWGGAYGAGVSFDLNPSSSIVLQWDRHDFHFVGSGREAVKATSLGYVHRF